MSQSKRVSAHYAGDAGARYAEWQIAYARITGHVLARRLQRHIRSDAVVVDFGCGGGQVLSQIRCARRIGVEPNPTAAGACRARGIEVHPWTRELDDGVADVVISNHALEHCRRPLDELEELARVLSPSGTLVLVVPINDWRNDRRYVPDEISHHLYTWTPLTLGHLLSEAGLAVRSIAITSDALPPRRLYAWWRSLPEWPFERICDVLGVLLRNRQMVAVCGRAAAGRLHRESD
jgi:SAM-dependent methyltransferase